MEEKPVLPILPVTLVGSYAQPDWLIDKRRLGERLPSRVRATELWRVAPPQLAEAQDDATALALRDQERAGLDVLTDGEMRRESYSNQFATALEGVDLEHPGSAIDRTGREVPVPRVVGPIRRRGPVEAQYVPLLRSLTSRPIKITLPGPFTMSQQAQNEHYPDDASLAMAYAAAVNEELLDLFRAGVDFVQIDEPYLQAHPEQARQYALPAIDRALANAPGPTVLHVCFGYGVHVAEKPDGYAFLDELNACAADEISIEAAQPHLELERLRALPDKRIHVGVLDLRDQSVEAEELVVQRIRAALRHVDAERLVVAPDCGMKYLDRPTAFGKMRAMASAAHIVRAELS
jgi:5-methyltetrahydropteroyltriglutamate--homocysteine methyltransferase